jgi:hypothetical protein
MEDPNEYRSLTTPWLSSDERLDVGALFRSGNPLGASWKPVRVELWENGDEARKPIGHFPCLSGLAPLAISTQGLHVLLPLIQNQVEALELITEPPLGKFYALNILFADCLDHSRSVFLRFDDGRIMRVEKYAFRPNCLEGKHLFRLPEKWPYVFADDVFKQAVERNKLEGLIFYKVPEADEFAK